MNRTYKCDKCDITFNNINEKANHIRWYHKSKEFYEQSRENMSNAAKINNNARFGDWIYEDIKCSNVDCINVITIKYRPNKKKPSYFCCRSHANSRVRTTEFKNTVSTKIKKLWAAGYYDDTTALNHLKQPKIFSSKNERAILKHFKEKYPDDGWTSGAGLVYKDAKISRDMYSKKLKICFEYDGVWHFVNIKNQLETKQHKDSLLEEWCIENNYKLVRIDEKKFINFDQVENLIYNTTGSIIKLGDRY